MRNLELTPGQTDRSPPFLFTERKASDFCDRYVAFAKDDHFPIGQIFKISGQMGFGFMDIESYHNL